jgi:hypothetical protein
MAPDSSAETSSSGAGSDGKSPMRVKSLMVMVAVVALGVGLFANMARTSRIQQQDQALFNAWLTELEKADPTLKPTGTKFRSTSMFLELTRTCDYNLLTPTRKTITIQVVLRTNPFSSVRKLTFDHAGHSVTWPFEDIERGRKIDLKTEFPEAFR